MLFYVLDEERLQERRFPVGENALFSCTIPSRGGIMTSLSQRFSRLPCSKFERCEPSALKKKIHPISIDSSHSLIRTYETSGIEGESVGWLFSHK